MENLIIEKTEDTPHIRLDFAEKKIVMEGRSLPEDVTSFYQPVLDWLEGLKNHPANDFLIEIRLEYFNTASSKLLLDILMKVEELHNNKVSSFNIKWYHDEGDTDMQEAAEEYAELVEVSIEIIAQ